MTRPCILLTRPSHDTEDIRSWATARNVAAVVEPMLEIQQIAGPPLDLTGVGGYLLTSANGVRALSARTEDRALPVYAVGDATARTARDLGFADVKSAGGDVNDLAELVCAEAKAEKGALLHAAGSAVAGDLQGMLSCKGFEYRRVVLYQAQAVSALSGSLKMALSEGSISVGLFFSPRTAKTFVTLAAPVVGATGLDGTDAICLSAAVADKVRDLPWRRVLIADQPTQTALLGLLGKVLS